MALTIATILTVYILALTMSNEAFALPGQVRTGGTGTSPVHTVPVQVHMVPSRVNAIPLWHTKQHGMINPPKVVLKRGIKEEPTLRGGHHAVLRGGTPKFGENFKTGELLGKPAGNVGYRPSSTPKFGENFKTGELLGKPASNSGNVQVASVPNQTPVAIVTIPTAITTWVLANEPQLGNVNIPTAITTGNVNITPTEISWYLHNLAMTGNPTARVDTTLELYTMNQLAQAAQAATWALENAWTSKIDIGGAKAGDSAIVIETIQIVSDAIIASSS
jgi:hypothetical protein